MNGNVPAGEAGNVQDCGGCARNDSVVQRPFGKKRLLLPSMKVRFCFFLPAYIEKMSLVMYPATIAGVLCALSALPGIAQTTVIPAGMPLRIQVDHRYRVRAGTTSKDI